MNIKQKAQKLLINLLQTAPAEDVEAIAWILTQLPIDAPKPVEPKPRKIPAKKGPRKGWSKEEEKELVDIFNEVTKNRQLNMSIEDIRQIMRKRIQHRTANALFAKMYRLNLLPYNTTPTGAFE